MHDEHWSGERRTAALAAGLFLVSLAVLDLLGERLAPTRCALWTGLALLVFAILVPPRVSAVPGRLSSRGLLTTREVRTDALVSVRWADGVAQRLVLRDGAGRRLELDPGVLVRNPALWHRVDADVRTAVRAGTLLCGVTAMRQLAERVDRESARDVFRASGLL